MTSARPPRLVLCGASPDTGNLGVSALCYGALTGIFRGYPDGDVTVFDEGHGLRAATAEFGGHAFPFRRCGATGTRRVWQRRSYWNMRVSSCFGGLGNPAVRRLIEADAVLDITGGDSFTDLYGPRRFRAGSAFKQFVLGLGKPLILLPQTYGPYRDPRHRAIAADIVRRAAMCWARDERSFATLRDLLGDAFDPQRHRSGVDVAFTLEPREPRAPLPEPVATWISCRGTDFQSVAATPLPARGGLEEGQIGHYHIDTETERERPVGQGLPGYPPALQGGVGGASGSSDVPTPAQPPTAFATCDSRFAIPSGLAPSIPRSLDPSIPPLVGFNVSGLIWHDPIAMRGRYGFKADYREVVLGFLRRLLLETDVNVLLISHVLTPRGHYESDPAASEAVIAALRDDSDSRVRAAAAERLAAVPPLYDHPSEAKWLIARCDWFCGTRMHACIAGLSTGVPTAALAYSLKTQGVFETCGVGHGVVDPRVLDTPTAVEALWAAWSARVATAATLRGQLGAVRARTAAPFHDLKEMLLSAAPVQRAGVCP